MNKSIKKNLALFFQDLLPSKHPVIWLDSDGPRPKGAYVSMKITPISSTENDEYINQADGSIKQIARKTYNLSIQAYRDGAFDILEKLKKNLRKTSYTDKFSMDMRGDDYKMNIGFTNDVADLTAIIETNFEERASLEITLNYGEWFIDNGVKDCGLGADFPVIIKGKYKKEDEEIAVEKTTTITK